MAVILVGDLEFDQTISKVNDTFGKLAQKEVVHPERPVETPLASIVNDEIHGPENEQIYMAYRTGAVGSDDEPKVVLIDMILNNSAAGLIDLNLNN